MEKEILMLCRLTVQFGIFHAVVNVGGVCVFTGDCSDQRSKLVDWVWFNCKFMRDRLLLGG